jgi:DNA-binding winged helix-turn-helix (wHTH) protein/TolB-like protein/tetratricopeptide (TPR) repeat protein
MQTANGRTYEIGEYRLDSAAHLLCRASDGSPIPLTPRVYDTLLFLVEHAGELLDKRRLMQAIWPNLVVEENNLDQNISTLRHVFGERRGENRYIVTVRGRGYRFVAPVRVAEPAAKDRELVPAVLADPSPSAAEQAPPPATESVPRALAAPRRHRLPTFAIAAAVAVAVAVVAVVAAAVALWPGGGTQNSVRDGSGLAVLPFRPLALADRNESLELGMAETLIAGLNGAGLTVRPLSAVRRFGSVEQDAVLAGRELGVSAVLEGHIQRDGDRLRVSARLLDVSGGEQLWASAYDERFTDIFSVQDAIAERVRAALMPELVGASPTLRLHTRDAEAYQLYVNGRFHRQVGNEGGLRRALAYFDEAIARDPRFADAYVGVAEAYSTLAVFGAVAPRDAFPSAQQAVSKALELAPDLGAAHASVGHIKTQYEHDWTGAERALRRALDLDPGYAPAHQWLGLNIASSGRFDEGLAHLRQAAALDSSSPIYSALIGMVLTYERRYDEAIAQLSTTLEMDPKLPTAHTYMALAHLRHGDPDEALRHIALVASPTPGSMGYVGQIHALSGRRSDALAEVERLVALSRERYVPAYDVATIYAALGDVDQTFVWLERAFDDRSTLIAWVPWDEVFDGIRRDPRYPVLVERLSVGASR